eukprot:342273-Chlamydomonas_euryale.AAC.2
MNKATVVPLASFDIEVELKRFVNHQQMPMQRVTTHQVSLVAKVWLARCCRHGGERHAANLRKPLTNPRFHDASKLCMTHRSFAVVVRMRLVSSAQQRIHGDIHAGCRARPRPTFKWIPPER